MTSLLVVPDGPAAVAALHAAGIPADAARAVDITGKFVVLTLPADRRDDVDTLVALGRALTESGAEALIVLSEGETIDVVDLSSLRELLDRGGDTP